MKRHYYLHTISCIILLVCTCSLRAQVALNQIMYDTPLNERITAPPYSNGEFVELYNYSTEDVQLCGWQVKGGGKTEVYTFDSIVLPAHQYLVLAYRHYNTPNFTLDSLFAQINISPTNTQFVYQRKIILSNEGESISIWDKTNNKVDSIYYDGTSNKRKEDRLSADNEDSIPYNTCVSLQRNNITIVNNTAKTQNADWVTAVIGHLPYPPTLTQGVDASYYTPSDNSNASNKNYVITVIPLDATSKVTFQEANVQIADNARAAVAITYYDNLGRPVQQNNLRVTPQSNDLVTMTEYSGLKNISTIWNATPFDNNNGGHIDSASFTSKAQQFYGDNMPYTSTQYENSSLYRPNAVRRAGAAWQGKPQKNRYRLNDKNEVLRFEVLNDSTLVCKGYYDAAQLQKIVTTDEDNKSTTSYTDKQGRKILQKVGPDTYTYYVYNFLGQLAYVLPPKLAAQLTNGNYTDSHKGLLQYAYVYKYDERGNCISKRLPGCEPHYMVYDKGGRLVQTQDGNQRARGDYWTVCMYDEWNRIVYTAEILTGHSNLQQAIAFCKDKNMQTSFTNLPIFPIGNTGNIGYSNFYYRNKLAKLLTVNYYDTYDFLAMLPDSVETTLTFDERNGYDAAVLDTTQLKGRLTGTRTCNLSDNSYIATANYYDIDGRLVQRRSTNQLGGMDNTYLMLDFAGNTLRQFTAHTASNEIAVEEQYTYTYDLANRLTSTTYKYNDDVPIILNTLHYDELGRVVNRQIYDAIDSVRYQYNIQNWVTRIKSSDFEENIYYNTEFALSPNQLLCYNGNISATSWTYDGKINGYTYYYDNQNRFSSTYSILDSQYGDYYYTEALSYDKNGNITQNMRWDNQDAMNILHYTYDGNQLTKVTDQGYAPIDYNCKRYMDLADEDIEMGYDANGNLIYDLDRQIVAIRYNQLNLPDTIQFANGNQIVNLYDALGNRYKTTYRTCNVTATLPLSIGTTLTNTDNSSDYTILTHATDKNIKYFAYGEAPLRLDYVFNSEGYIRYDSIGQHISYYYIKDHLGSVRETYKSPTKGVKECVQRMQYYPSGLPWNENFYENEQPYKYNGKEFVEMHGLDEYDSEARWYYPALGRTTTIDPLAEKYYDISPYAWCGNNMVNFVDLHGDSIQIAEQDRERMDEALREVFEDEADNFDYTETGMLIYKGDGSSLSTNQKQILKGLRKIMEEDITTNIIYAPSAEYTTIDGQKCTVYAAQGSGAITVLASENSFGKENIILIDPSIPAQIDVYAVTDVYYITPIDPDNGDRFKKTTIQVNINETTFHELGHVIYQGKTQDKVIDFNNKVRKILKMPKRPYDETHNSTITKNIYKD